MNIFKIENIKTLSDAYFVFSALNKVYKEALRLYDKDLEEFLIDLELYWEDEPVEKCHDSVEVTRRVFSVYEYIIKVYEKAINMEKYDVLLDSIQSNILYHVREELIIDISNLMRRYNRIRGL